MRISRGTKWAATALVAALLAVSAVGASWADETEEGAPDHLALAALTIRDGHFDRAEAVLARVDEDDKSLDRPRYYTLRGLLLLRRGLFLEARESLEKAIDAGQTEPLVHLYLAQAHYGAKDYDKALAALDAAGPEAQAIEGAYILRTNALWKTDRREEAWRVLAEGAARFPENSQFARARTFYLLELGLYQQAVESGQAYLAGEGGAAEDYVAIGEALRRSGETGKAQQLLEIGRLRYPDSVEILATLAHAYLDADQDRAAAGLFEQAARRDASLAVETAELYRRQGLYHQALYLNARVSDQKEKVKQRLGILLEMGRYTSAVALAPRLSRLGLLSDEEVRYALAYSYFKIGQYEQAEAQLSALKRADLFRNAGELRKAMDACRESPWLCP
ncbi:tetratricopeptide repeat protein [bacterium]|nr:tetratricopeptide repeat protein [bacterium]MCB9476171.1 tetratricopeptide repeat protein [Deltaproteobacteria bacterium]